VKKEGSGRRFVELWCGEGSDGGGAGEHLSYAVHASEFGVRIVFWVVGPTATVKCRIIKINSTENFL
jgi:hypothetical protein